MRIRPLSSTVPSWLVVIFSGLLSAQDAAKPLQDVHSIYVDSFKGGDAADAIRSKIILELGKIRRLEVVASADQADAVLTGASQIAKVARNAPKANSRNADRYHATAGVRLIGKDQNILWADDPSIGAPSHFTATSSLADRIVKDLLKAISKEAKTK
jgi:hypothetical protein